MNLSINKLILLLSILLIVPSASAMKLTGRLNITAPVDLGIYTVDGRQIISIPLQQSGDFSSEDISIVPDIYFFKIGETKEPIYLDNSDITLNGYLDPASAENSQLRIEGIEANDKFQVMFQNYKAQRGKLELLEGYATQGKANPFMISAMNYLQPQKTYEQVQTVLSLIPEGTPRNPSYEWLKEQEKNLYRYRIGGPFPEVILKDTEGKDVKLADYKGKIILLDFWASWCGPCKAELKKLKNYYPQFEGTDIEFISISIDNTQADWEKGMEEEQIPWVNLWDPSGGINVSPLKEELGFQAIPFLMIVDQHGTVVARGIRGAEVEKKLVSLIENR